ncbi:MAG TPA: NAD-dependent epimerase/dehydratase family protein [Stellaceae bacterium]|nr:NAD-dependent epimerase/dehydratase family protein [Stellaceae bacterium]
MMDRICILGGDGYLGWPTAMSFAAKGHRVLVVDDGIKRRWEAEVAARPLVAIPPLSERAKLWNRMAFQRGAGQIDCATLNVASDPEVLEEVLAGFRPATIIHYAEQPSAPFSMASRDKAVRTQHNNVVGTLNLVFAVHARLPDAHIVKLGTLGEYGTPNIDIEEGWLDLEHNGRRDRVLFPKKPGSIYHLSKVHDSANLEFACRVYNLRVTDLNQGVVYGIETDQTALAEGLHTSFHYDAVFGTVLNRFIVQAALGLPLSIYGRGHQRRGFLDIRDTLRCVDLAASNPAKRGEFRVFNQLTEQFSIRELAERVTAAGRAEGLDVEVRHLDNPRVEAEDHYYNVRHSGLMQLGLEPHLLSIELLRGMIRTVVEHRHAIDQSSLHPQIAWRTGAEAQAGEREETLAPQPIRLVG